MLLLCIIFAMNPELADGTLSGKICWFHFTSLLLAGGVLLMEFTTKKSRFIFSLPDALLLLLFGIVLISYDKDENLQPNVSFSSLNWSPFGLCSEVLYRRIRNYDRFHYNHHIYRNRSGHLGDQPCHQSCSHHPSCLQVAWNIAETRAFLWLYRSHFSSLSEHITPF